MYIFIKLLQITLLLFVSFTLALVPWIHSSLLDNIVNFTIIGLFIATGYLVYLIIQSVHYSQKKRNLYISAFYAFLIFSYLGLFAILQIGVSMSKSQYVQTYVFEPYTFYTYKTTDGAIEVSQKDKHLPIRSLPIALFDQAPIVLEKKENYIYAVGEGFNIKVYDLKNDIPVKQLNNKDEHE
ncbi:MAG TPA: hypothetical protein EYH57_03335 [Sulfurovum sp.]|nr:hypothetical protein [Sulfurovum sp.]